MRFSVSAFVLVSSFLIFLACSGGATAGECIRTSDGNVVCGEGQCATDQYGKVLCAKAGGGAIRDQNGNVKCGVGFCAMEDSGQAKCSTKAGGSAATDSNGKVKCLGGCTNATRQLCTLAR